MPTYLYETVSDNANTAPTRFEVRQGFDEPPLASHPETGVPVRRVISGGLGLMGVGGKSAPEQPAPGPGCGPGSCGCGRF